MRDKLIWPGVTTQFIFGFWLELIRLVYCYSEVALYDNDSDQVAIVGAVFRPTERLLMKSGQGRHCGHGGVVKSLRQHPALFLHHDIGGCLSLRSFWNQLWLMKVLLVVAVGHGGVDPFWWHDCAAVSRVALSSALFSTSSQLTCSVKLIPWRESPLVIPVSVISDFLWRLNIAPAALSHCFITVYCSVLVITMFRWFIGLEGVIITTDGLGMVMVTIGEAIAQFSRRPVTLDPPLAFSLIDPAMEISW